MLEQSDDTDSFNPLSRTNVCTAQCDASLRDTEPSLN